MEISIIKIIWFYLCLRLLIVFSSANAKQGEEDQRE